MAPLKLRIEEPKDEVEVTLMKKVAPERFDVLVGTIRGEFTTTKVLEKSVSLVVARGRARASIDKQTNAAKAKLGMSVDS